jgi:hypothetical protein
MVIENLVSSFYSKSSSKINSHEAYDLLQNRKLKHIKLKVKVKNRGWFNVKFKILLQKNQHLF